MSDDSTLNILLAEYSSLKAEQAQRIGFRDNLLYVTLGVLGGIVSFAVSKPAHSYALLVIPWVCLILGWTYVVNDEKISAIGRYIRYKLVNKIQAHTGYSDLETLLGWEIAHRDDKHRKRRKFYQLIVDEITFVLSGIIALLAFGIQSSSIPPVGLIILAVLELICLIVLGIEIIIYADLGKGR
ncbi:MAG: hypothetical protein AAGD25_23840 [Cyanobacteria bacterium P01_F01_bin.150]